MNSRPSKSPRFTNGLGLLLLLPPLLGGCLSRAPLVHQSFAFSLPPTPTARASTRGPVVEIQEIRVAAPFDSQTFVYRTGSLSYERDPYAQFLVAPGESFLSPLRGYLRDSGVFSNVTGPDTALGPDLIARVYISQLYGDFVNPAAPAAVLNMQFIFFQAHDGAPGKIVLERDYARRVALKTRTAAAVMAAWNQALQEIMGSVTADLKTAL